MIVRELLDILVRAAKSWAPDAPASVVRNQHMNAYRGPKPARDLTDLAFKARFLSVRAGS